MEKIKIRLTKNENDEVVLSFLSENNKLGLINLEKEDTELDKEVFLNISSLLIQGKIDLVYEKDTTKDFGNDELLVDVADAYVDILKEEISNIEQNDDLKKLRLKQKETENL